MRVEIMGRRDASRRRQIPTCQNLSGFVVLRADVIRGIG